MSEVTNKAKVLAPPVFPQEGRLPGTSRAVGENYARQTREANLYKQARDENGRRQHGKCCQAVHISLFFDGTNNNEKNDTETGHPTNIARLFHASYRSDEAEKMGYFSYYMPGVGTPFPEIGEMDYSGKGLQFALGGEDRINWALLSVADALSYAVTKQHLVREVRSQKVKDMATWPAPLMIALGAGKRRRVMQNLLQPLQQKMEQVPPTPKPLKVKLYIYGFSRGAAEARTFVNWLSELFETPEGADRPEQKLAGLDVSVEFLGLLDTVASVGIAHAAPFFAGHMDWADDSQLLPSAAKYPNLVKCCRHFVAAFEQRSCFPLDSIRNEDGQYPANTLEVVYPGVHSDVGGGYQKNDQGKARGGTQELISQIALHDLYAEAFAAGAPLQVPEEVLPEELKDETTWRRMAPGTRREFDISPQVIERFNAWRHTLGGLPAESSGDAPWVYRPVGLNKPVEEALAEQLGWITGWRIGRYANGSYKTQPFFIKANEDDNYKVKVDRADNAELQTKAKDKRLETPETAVNHPGPPIYEPWIDKTQLSQAAEEFRYDYSGEKRKQTSGKGTVVDVVLRGGAYLLNDNDERGDHATLKEAGETRHKQLFQDELGTPSADPKMALVVALFDDQIHDSRAWFMHDALESRELWAGYFFYRMVYFGNKSSRRLTAMMVAGKLLGVAIVAGTTVYGVRLLRGNNRGVLGAGLGVVGGGAGVIAGLAAAGVAYEVIDLATGLALPFLPGAAELLKPTDDIGTVVAEQKRRIALEDYAQRMQRSAEFLRRSGSLVEQARGVLA
ncbi:DUF2235 domain-containing protein [Metapseudomonas resinovorans]|uniref:DUF2235 domain-containing protein n=1 Tax=Metapseudomonas resinovorans NBRC 106553 TaxID=1245471 RepID=S6AEF9_METRE|nr:DUF2235 domain-containing protein [Pseudomonas resinovorans]BAN45900.1 hypothetical protein PCA10_01680 [Pseudomonas resinovorans NBRC 106553]